MAHEKIPTTRPASPTGRLSPSEPAMQGIHTATPEGRRIRAAFLPATDRIEDFAPYRSPVSHLDLAEIFGSNQGTLGN